MRINQLCAKILGVVLLAYGAVGLFTAGSFIMTFGNTWHNIIHLATGAIFAWAGFSPKAPVRKVNISLGVTYAAVGLVGFSGALDVLMGLSQADNWTHLAVGVASAVIGWKAK